MKTFSSSGTLYHLLFVLHVYIQILPLPLHGYGFSWNSVGGWPAHFLWLTLPSGFRVLHTVWGLPPVLQLLHVIVLGEA